jgi:organic radical activating enzyme
MLDEYTSTGKKFLRHRSQIEQYIKIEPRTIISTHISPEGSCNLNCSYCCQSKRKRNSRIDLMTIRKYIQIVHSLGCKSVILTGGGEPTVYPKFMDILGSLEYLYPKMQYALITNGTRIEQMRLWRVPFEWIRISINNTPVWIDRFNSISQRFPEGCTVGLSMVYAGSNKRFSPTDILKFADQVKAEYIRIIPDTTLCNKDLKEENKIIKNWLGLHSNDQRFMIQTKSHKAPDQSICHQSYFRPFLSELKGGTIFPCDSICLNKTTGYFDEKYALCKPLEIREYLNKKSIFQSFDAHKDCSGCVFTNNINMLDGFLSDPPEYLTEPIKHENFI